jgi:hypothetical protein
LPPSPSADLRDRAPAWAAREAEVVTYEINRIVNDRRTIASALARSIPR